MSTTSVQSSPAAALPVLFRSVVALNRETHRDLKLERLPEPLAFARGTHLIPALLDEFVPAARELPIVFLPEGDLISPVFLLSLRAGVNSFVTSEGLWSASYMPAYIRRYPFVLADVEGRDPVVCMDESFEGLGKEKGEALFTADGAPTKTLEAAMQFAAEFRQSGLRTTAFVRTIKTLDLFKSVTMDVKSSKVGKATIHGLLVIDEEKLRALPGDAVAKLHKEGLIPAIYAHLLSLGAVAALG